MPEPQPKSDPLLAACDALLREVAGHPLTEERLDEVLPLVRKALAAIRMMDEVDVDGVEPMTAFRPL